MCLFVTGRRHDGPSGESPVSCGRILVRWFCADYICQTAQAGIPSEGATRNRGTRRYRRLSSAHVNLFRLWRHKTRIQSTKCTLEFGQSVRKRMALGHREFRQFPEKLRHAVGTVVRELVRKDFKTGTKNDG